MVSRRYDGKRGRRSAASLPGSNGSREQARALIPLKLALHELHPDEGRRTQCLSLVREFDQTGVERMVVHAFHTGIDNSKLTCAGG